MFTATVTDAVAGVDPARVLLTATDVNSSATDLVMFDDGTNGDAVAGDDVWTRVVEVNSGLTGVFTFTVSADDIVPNGSSRTGCGRPAPWGWRRR